MNTLENTHSEVKISKNGTLQAPENGEKWHAMLAQAEGALSPALNGAAVLEVFSKPSLGKVDVVAAVAALNEQIEDIQKGNMSGPEAMLFVQATALQSIFVMLSRKAIDQQGLAQYQAYLTLAFRAQAQCRATLEALNEIKFPKSATFVKQANIANNQQVNNGTLARAGEKAEPTNKLLKEADHGTLDTGTTEPAGQSHPRLETVGEINRAKNQPRQKAERTKRT